MENLQTAANGGVTTAEKMMEEQKEGIAKAQQEIKKDLTKQSESLQTRLAERKKRLALKNSMNHSMYSEGGGGGFDYPLMSTTNANFQKMQLLKV